MTSFERGIIDLVKSGLTGCSVEIPMDFDWDCAIKLSKKHKIVPIIYYGCINSGIKISSDYWSSLELATFKSVSTSVKQLYELNQIYNAFENNGIDYMPLKGSILKDIYKKPELRSMGDADILIKTAQYKKIRALMTELCYTEVKESNHELIWDKPGALYLELHKCLIPSYNKDYYSYFKDGWELAHRSQNNKYLYKLSNEDNFLYLFTHYAKHYRDAGIGIRHICDLYIFIQHFSDLDKVYIENGLKELALYKFYLNTMSTIAAWFEQGKTNDITDFLTSKILNSGAYGTNTSKVLSTAIRNSGAEATENTARLKRVFDIIFLPLKAMQKKYPILIKAPVLLPAMWIIRLVSIMINKPDKFKKQNNNLKLLTQKNIKDYQRELEFVGLSFDSKE